MAQRLPLTNDARQVFTTVLDSQKIRLTAYYLEDYINISSNGWYCNLILLSDMEQIITLGEKLLSEQYIARNINNELSGRIYVVPITAPKQDLISSESWNITHELVYFTSGETFNGVTI